MYTHILAPVVVAALIAPACLAQDSVLTMAGVFEQMTTNLTKMTETCLTVKDAASSAAAIPAINKLTADLNDLDKKVATATNPQTPDETKALQDAAVKLQAASDPIAKAMNGIPAAAQTPEFQQALTAYGAAVQKLGQDINTARGVK